MKVAAVQHDIAWEDREATLARLVPMLDTAQAAGARLIVLSEMFAVGFSMAAERIAEPPDGPTVTWLCEQAARRDLYVCGSVPTRSTAARPTNQFVLAGPDGVIVRYDKLHPFSYAGEDEHYAAGDQTVTVELDGVRITPFVCYDLRFANVFWSAADATDLYVVVANWPAARRRHWSALLTARAIENQAYVIGVNRVGLAGDGLEHAGDSCIIDPMGELLATAAGIETVITADVDAEVVATVRKQLPFLPDRRD